MREYIYSLMTDKATGFIASIMKFLLFLASLLYLLGIKIIFLMRQNGVLSVAHLEAKVISIGNLTLGGTGKTPLVELVARILLDRGSKVVVLTRGYRIRTERGQRISVTAQPLLFEEIGDEPALLYRNVPNLTILAGPNRIEKGRTAILKYGADVLLLDDGFQQWGLSRGIDILVINALNPFGNEKLLPRGILREPVSNMVRANIVVITKTDMATAGQISNIKNRIKLLSPDALVVLSMHKPVKLIEFANFAKPKTSAQGEVNLNLDWIKGKDFVAVCGIGDPAYFLKTLENVGVVVKGSLIFEDHHPYSFQDLALISNKCHEASTNRLITTEKDMIKLKPLIENNILAFESLRLEFFALGVQLEIIENQDKFIEHLTAK